MKTDPIGSDAYKGLGVPLFGESVIRQRNSSNAIVTLMPTAANAGRLMMGMDYKDLDFDPLGGSTLPITDLALFDIDADGGFRTVSGTTVLMELNSSGLYSGSRQIVNSSKELAGYVQDTVDISSDGTTAFYLVSTNAGKMHVVAETSASGFSSVVVSLPTSASTGISVGMWWDIMCPNTSASGVVDLALIGADHSILAHHGSTGAVATSIAITHATSGPFWWRVMCATTGSTMTYAVSNMLGTNGSTSATYDGLLEGSSALS